ncbi:MAG: hypothetical protein MUE52_11275 [Tabrizicola sp.]|nr:hypothetical protein [Tabrizicola sp.]
MIDWLESTGLAEHLRRSRWTYPLVSAGHLLGIAVLLGALVPMQVQRLRGLDPMVRVLRPYAIAGLALAAGCGVLLFMTRAEDYLANPAFQAKLALLAIALAHATWYLRLDVLPKRATAVSLLLWLGVLGAGRMIAFA